MRRPGFLSLIAAFALAAAPVAAQEPPPRPQPAEPRGIPGEAIGYLALPALLVLVLLIGVVLGVDSDPFEDEPVSP